MDSSVPEYKKYFQILIRRKELFTLLALLIITTAFAISYLLPKKYESSSTVFIENNVVSEMVKGLTITPSMDDTIRVLTYAITSRSLIMQVLDKMGIDVGKDDAAAQGLIKQLQASTQVKLKDNHLFTISFIGPDAHFAKDFVNTLVQVYIQQNMSSKRGQSYDATKFLNEQIAVFNAKLQKAENEVNDYKREKGGIISLDEGTLFKEISIAQQKLYDLQLRQHQLEGMRQVTRKSSNPLLSQLNSLQKKLDDLLVRYTDSYPEVIQTRTEIETIREQLNGKRGIDYQPLDPQDLAKIDAEIAAIKISVAGLERYISSNKILLKGIPAAKAGLEKLELEKQNQKNLYDQLFARQGQSEVSKQIEAQDKSTTFRVVDPAILPVKAVSPNRLKIMLMGIFAGFAASFGLVFLLDQMDGTVKDVDSVKGFGAPVLAVIPKMRHPALVVRQRRRTVTFFSVAGLYFLLMLVFPVMELLDLPFMDRVFSPATAEHAAQTSTGFETKK